MIALLGGVPGDAEIYWDGSDLIVDPDQLSEGSGRFLCGATADDDFLTAGLLWRFADLAALGIITITATTYTAASEHVILVDDDTAGSTVTITLPPAANSNRIYHIKKLGTTANVDIDGDAAETIDGLTVQTLSSQYDSLMVVSDGTEWHII